MNSIESQSHPWNPATRIAFRFCFAYLLLYIIPFPFTLIPYLGYVFQPFFWLTSEATGLLGPVLFGTDYRPAELNGSGDSSNSYTVVVLYGVLASLITLIWSVIDRRTSHPKLLTGLNVVLRYYLAMQMLGYGFFKVFPSQFPPLPESWLNQTFGEASPMRLFWAFMGYSKSYTIFSGLAEVTAGLLLLFRRTKLLGAMVAAMVMLHVVVLNFSYDVPVKILSSHLFVMAVVILAPDLGRLIRFFVLNQAVHTAPIENYFVNRKKRIAGYVFKGYAIALIILPSAYRGWQQYQVVHEHHSRTSGKPRLTGAYEVETFTLNNDTLPPREDDTRRWRSVMISARSVQIQSMDGFTMAWNCLVNDSEKGIDIRSRDGFTAGTFAYTIDGEMLHLKGKLNDNLLVITARKKSENAFLLTNRGFHWINEAPFNQ